MFCPVVIPSPLVEHPFIIPLLPAAWYPYHACMRRAPPMSFYPKIAVISQAPLVISRNPYSIAIWFRGNDFFFYRHRRTDLYPDTDMKLSKSRCHQSTNCEYKYVFHYYFHSSPPMYSYCNKPCRVKAFVLLRLRLFWFAVDCSAFLYFMLSVTVFLPLYILRCKKSSMV